MTEKESENLDDKNLDKQPSLRAKEPFFDTQDASAKDTNITDAADTDAVFNQEIRSRLSIKILLMLFFSLFVMICIFLCVFRIMRAAGATFPANGEETGAWFQRVVYIFPPVFGIGIVVLFSLILNKTVVARIRKLEKATKTLANGSYDVSLEVKGCDELSELTHSFNQMAAQLRANEYINKDFVRNVSHEFKTPLSTIRVCGELIEAESDKETTDRAALKNYCKIIMEESTRLAGLSKNILVLSMLDSAEIIKKDDHFSPAEQIRGILRLMHNEWAEKNIVLDLGLKDYYIVGNEQLLYQVWQNLISNAIKFTGIDGKIKIILAKTEGIKKGDAITTDENIRGEATKIETIKNDKLTQGMLYFEITDSGVGIKDEDKDKIFNQFFMSDQSRRTDGSGLGLSIVKKIVEKLGGKIDFESKENDGTKFFVFLPV